MKKKKCQYLLKKNYNDIKVMIETIEDLAGQLAVLHCYKENKNEDLEFLEIMLQDIFNGKYSV